MSDKELLELAAKAHGKIVFDPMGLSRLFFDSSREMDEWNPLIDDGDALRLAAKLRLLIKPGKHLGDGCTVESQRNGIAGCTAFYDDKDEQMRRAIVQVAANIAIAYAAAIGGAK